jgi:hypothetical protein
MAISRINPSTLLSKVRLLMRVADLSKPVPLTFMGLGTDRFVEKQEFPQKWMLDVYTLKLLPS